MKISTTELLRIIESLPNPNKHWSNKICVPITEPIAYSSQQLQEEPNAAIVKSLLFERSKWVNHGTNDYKYEWELTIPYIERH